MIYNYYLLIIIMLIGEILLWKRSFQNSVSENQFWGISFQKQVDESQFTKLRLENQFQITIFSSLKRYVLKKLLKKKQF